MADKKLYVWNKALINIGISNLLKQLDDNRSEVDIIGHVYDSCVEELLKKTCWTFLRDSASLTFEEESDAGNYSYELPTDCSFICKVLPESYDIITKELTYGRFSLNQALKYSIKKVDDKKYVTSPIRNAKIIYIKELTTDMLDEAPQYFLNALSWIIAENITTSLDGKIKIKDAFTLKENYIEAAIISDAEQENIQDETEGDNFLSHQTGG